MEINNMMQANLYSVQQALGMATMRKALSQDAQSVAALLQDMQAVNASVMEQSVSPHLGGNVDVRV